MLGSPGTKCVSTWCLTVAVFAVAGYLFRNAQYRLELQRSIDEADGGALPSRPEAAEASEPAYAGWDGFAEGSQTKHVQVLPVGHSLMLPPYGCCP